MAKIKKILLCITLLLFVGTTVQTVYATTGYEKLEYHNDTIFTTDKGDKTITDRQKDHVVKTSNQSAVLNVGTGQHIYKYTRHGVVPIGYWKLEHYPAQCIHTHPKEKYLSANEPYVWEGMSFNSQICSKFYNRGWHAYCVDCGDKLNDALFYASDDTIDNTTHLNVDHHYYYACPHCNHLENTDYGNGHQCNAVSYNRYFVKYHANGGTKNMSHSTHYYNNSTTYEGLTVIPQKKLSLNTFERVGYTFTGWNTSPDGTGTAYANGQEIFNLTSEQNGIINLYAQWSTAKSTLNIDPNGGKYKNSTNITTLNQDYGSTYDMNVNDFTKNGYTITFDMNGHGTQIPTITTTQSLDYLEEVSPFAGKLEYSLTTNGKISNYKYLFTGANNSSSTVKAHWKDDSFTLPNASDANYVFGGWYTDRYCSKTNYYGKSGDIKTTDKNITLYAEWSNLTLTSVDDYTSNNGHGAVDLSWYQPSNIRKYYKLYQAKTKDGRWYQVKTNTDIGNYSSSPQTFTSDATYTVTVSGEYQLLAAGGNGGNYGSYNGGKGGYIYSNYYLHAGDVLYFYPGSSGTTTAAGTNSIAGYDGGAVSGSGAGGGAASIIQLVRNGTTYTLLVAGGGGGANAGAHGGDGGYYGGNTGSTNGASGAGSGGGGAVGGTTGTAIEQPAVKQMVKANDKDYRINYEYKGAQESRYKIESPDTNSTATVIDDIKYYKYTTKDHGDVYLKYRVFSFEPRKVGNQHIVKVSDSEDDGVMTLSPIVDCGKKCKNTTGLPVYHHIIQQGDKKNCERVFSFFTLTETPANYTYTASRGGTSYRSTDFGASGGSETIGYNSQANGYCYMRIENIGYKEITSLNDVKAKDEAAPNIIDINKVTRTAKNTIIDKITWQNPGDNGTDYFHYVESYKYDDFTYLTDSNTTINTLTTGVTGYRYYVNDSSAVGTVTTSNSTYTTNNYYETTKNKTQYLHVAAVDKVGNIGPEVVIPLSFSPTKGPIYTSGILVEEILPDDYTEDMHYIYEDDDVIYVKGDKMFEFDYGGYMEYKARDNYQINQITLTSKNNNNTQYHTITMPNKSIALQTHKYDLNEIQLTNEGPELMLQEYLMSAYKYNYQTSLNIESVFNIPHSSDGKEIEITPTVIAQYEKELVYSDSLEDSKNAITLIGDSAGPKITCTNNSIENTQNIGKITFAKKVDFKIEDLTIDEKGYGSGLDQNYSPFKIILENKETGLVKIYDSNTPEDELDNVFSMDYGSNNKTLNFWMFIDLSKLGGFEGESTLTLEFRDNVGNISSKTYNFVGDTTSDLTIDANNGIFNDNTIDSSFVRDDNEEILYKSAKYQTIVNLPSIKAGPDGYVATFVSGNYGVSDIDKIVSKTKFSYWKYDPDPLNGEIIDNKYIFLGAGTSDRLIAQYTTEPITLPNVKENTDRYKFIGWYYTSIDVTDQNVNANSFAGMPGDKITLDKNRTLWARYSTLVLTSTPNYIANDKKGAIDAKWIQNDDFLYRKKYVLWQQELGSDWVTVDKNGNLQQ